MFRPALVLSGLVLVGAFAMAPVVRGADDEPVDPLSQSFMTVSVAYLNQSFLALGMLGDAYNEGIYEDEQAGELLGAHFDLAVSVKKQLTTLSKAPGLDADDVTTIKQLIKIAEQLEQQAVTLEDLWNGDESKVKLWNELRDATAKELATFDGADTVPEAAAKESTTQKK